MPEDLDDLDFDDMGDDAGESSDTGGGGGGLRGLMSGSLVRILLYVAAVIVIVIIAVIAGSWAGRRSSDDTASREAIQIRDEKAEPLATFALTEFMTNTADRDTPHLVRLRLQLAFDKNNIQLSLELNDRRAQIRDIILLFINEKKKEEMESAQQKERLKRELMSRINRILKNGEVKDIYYEEFSVT